MAATNSTGRISSKDFFAEIESGRKVLERARDGRTIELILRSPSTSDTERAYQIIESLNYDSDLEIEKSRLIQHACCSCIDGVHSDNVMAFLSYFPPVCYVIVECLRLLRIAEDDMRRLDIEPTMYEYEYDDEIPF